MKNANELSQKEAEILKLIEEKFSIQKGALSQRMRRVGRRVPKRVQAAAKEFSQALSLSTHPQLSRQIDAKQVDRAYVALRDYLKTVDPVDRRKGALLSLLGGLSFNILAITAVLILILLWRGWI